MEKKTKNWALILLIIGCVLGCWKMKDCCREKCKCSGKKRKSVIKMKNCNGCWVISFK